MHLYFKITIGYIILCLLSSGSLDQKTQNKNLHLFQME